jgi:hypothetical protein
MLFYGIIGNALVVIALWRIFARAGLPPAWSLIGLLLPIIPWFILAFARWPAAAGEGGGR